MSYSNCALISASFLTLEKNKKNVKKSRHKTERQKEAQFFHSQHTPL